MFSRLAQLAKGGFANPTFNVLKRHMGRKTGTKFLEFPVRAPSKKQQKRRAKFMERLSSQRDPQKEAIRMSKMDRQYSNPKIEEELKAMMSSMDQDILTLSKPQPQNEFELLNGYDEQSSSSLSYKVHGKVLLMHLSQYERNQKAMVDTGIEENGSIKSDTKSLPDKSGGNAVTVVQGSSLTTSELEQEANAFLIVKLRKFFGTLHPLFQRKSLTAEYETLPKLFTALHRHKLHIDMESYVRMIQLFSYFGQYQNADTFFNEALELCPPEDVDTTLKLWSVKLENLCRSGQIKEALTTLDRLQNTLKTTSTVLYNPLLRVLVDNRHKEESDSFWIRMHSDGVDLDVESFNIYLKGLAFRGEVERTFFVFREMVSLQLQPNTQSFSMLLHACGRAPWHVKGYEDIVFDALDLMEAAEYKPNKAIYTALINTFAQPGDAMAAEYYFWEMHRKGIQPDTNTFNALLEAYSRAQSVGLKYGFKGRYTPPKPQPMSEDERAMIEIGAARYGKLMAAGLTAEPLQPGRGTKNELKKTILIDSFEDNDAREATMSQIRREAQEIRVARRAALEKELEAKGWEFSVLNRFKGLEVREALPEKEVEALVDVSEDEEDDGKVRITWDDADELEQALSRGSNELSNFEFRSNSSGDSIEGKALSRRYKSKGEGGAIDLLNDDRIDDIDMKDFDDDEDEDDDVDEDFEQSDDDEEEDDEGNDEEDEEDTEYGLTEEQRRIKFLDEILDENTPIGQYKKREMFYRRIWDNMRDESFSDPFEGEEGLKGQLWAEERRRQLNEQNPADPEGQSNGKGAAEDTSKDIFLQVAQRVNVLGALDRPQDVKKDLELMRREVDSEWDFLAFGRAPSQDYAIDLLDKQKIIARRALKVFDVMIQQGIKPNLSHWNRLLAVYAEGVQKKDAVAVFNSMKEANMVDARTYEYMIRLFIRTGDMDKALAMKDAALAGNMKPTEESYGLILRLFTHRKMTAEALKILEEAHSKGITIHERNIKHLRKQCDALGVKHPNIPPDPHAWVKEVKQERFKKRDTSQRRVQSLLSKSFRG